MIVDDSVDMRRLLRDVVAPLTRSVVECADGQEYLDRYAECQPDWTIMDVRMPRLDGLSATREVLARWPSARVLLITQFPSPALDAAARDYGAVGCLGKDDLYRVVDVLEGPTSEPCAPFPDAVP